MNDFLDKVEDFLEKGAELNKFSICHSKNKRVWHFVIGRERLTLIKGIFGDTAILNDDVGELPFGFTSYVIKTLKPEFGEE